MDKICKTNGFSMRKETDKCGTIRYYNKNNELHREEGPAIEWAAYGYKAWYRNGNLHREDGPAREFASGKKEYWYNDINYPEIKTNEEWIKFIKLIIFM